MHFNVQQINNLFAYFDTVKIKFLGFSGRITPMSANGLNKSLYESNGGLILSKWNYSMNVMQTIPWKFYKYIHTHTQIWAHRAHIIQNIYIERERKPNKIYICKCTKLENRTKPKKTDVLRDKERTRLFHLHLTKIKSWNLSNHCQNDDGLHSKVVNFPALRIFIYLKIVRIKKPVYSVL